MGGRSMTSEETRTMTRSEYDVLIERSSRLDALLAAGSVRRKLGNDATNPKYIFAEPRVGYRMPE